MRLFSDIIADKRNGLKLSGKDINFFLNSYMNGDVRDYQMSAMLMAVYFNGLDREELSVWTEKMLNSGTIMDFSGLNGIIADKHSTGGVGDKISIPLAPALASLGFYVPMISGRGLGHTGGTLDKLESIPGFSVNLSLHEFKKQTERIGCALIGQTPEIAPLDKKLYALRDVTATVESIPLIASSIMSKKLAEGIKGLVLDVKVGKGAFMKDFKSAKELAETMKSIGETFGMKVCIIFSRMDEPLGYKIGNSLEIEESIDVLKGKYIPQINELVEIEGSLLLKRFDRVKDINDGRLKIREVLNNGSAMKKFLEVVESQGGDTKTIVDTKKMPKSKYTKEIKAEREGFLESIDPLGLGKALVMLGGGRLKQEDKVDPAVGFTFLKKTGDYVNISDVIYTIHYNESQKLDEAGQYLENLLKVTDEKTGAKDLILGTMF